MAYQQPKSYSEMKFDLPFPTKKVNIEKKKERTDAQGNTFTKVFLNTIILCVCRIPVPLPESFMTEFQEEFDSCNEGRSTIRIEEDEDQPVSIKGRKFYKITTTNTSKGFHAFILKLIKGYCIENHDSLFGTPSDERPKKSDSKSQSKSKKFSGTKSQPTSDGFVLKLKIDCILDALSDYRALAVRFVELFNANPKATILHLQIFNRETGRIFDKTFEFDFTPYRYISGSPVGQTMYSDEDEDKDLNDLYEKVGEFHTALMDMRFTERDLGQGHISLIIPNDPRPDEMLESISGLRKYAEDTWRFTDDDVTSDDWVNLMFSIGVYGLGRMVCNFNIALIVDIIKNSIQMYGFDQPQNRRPTTYADFLDFATTEREADPKVRNREIRKLIKLVYQTLMQLNIQKDLSDSDLRATVNTICGANSRTSANSLVAGIQFNIELDDFIIELDSKEGVERKDFAKDFLKAHEEAIKQKSESTLGKRIALSSKLHSYNLLEDGRKIF